MSVSLQWVTVVVMVWRQVSAYMTPLTGIALSQLSQEKISYLNLQRSDHSLIVDHWYQIQSFESSITSLKLLLRKRIILPRMLWHYLVESWAFCGCGYNRADCYNVKYRPETWDKDRQCQLTIVRFYSPSQSWELYKQWFCQHSDLFLHICQEFHCVNDSSSSLALVSMNTPPVWWTNVQCLVACYVKWGCCERSEWVY